ncbi:uncharacterized protein LOC119726423 [Patiria miniata]|uniref:Uncharacterized protein n=1 Tax=Patiria miniata TaxID=46514 RepID=A0A913ZS51_PATMI|nr:uncharacterized protein LOC119726423 [Patiria miniata]
MYVTPYTRRLSALAQFVYFDRVYDVSKPLLKLAGLMTNPDRAIVPPKVWRQRVHVGTLACVQQPKRPSVDTADNGPVETEVKKKKKSQKDKKHDTMADITRNSEESRPLAKQGDTQGGDDRLAGEGEVEDDRVTTKAHRKGKKRKQQRRVQNDDTVHQSPINTEETQPIKKKKKHKK